MDAWMHEALAASDSSFLVPCIQGWVRQTSDKRHTHCCLALLLAGACGHLQLPQQQAGAPGQCAPGPLPSAHVCHARGRGAGDVARVLGAAAMLGKQQQWFGSQQGCCVCELAAAATQQQVLRTTRWYASKHADVGGSSQPWAAFTALCASIVLHGQQQHGKQQQDSRRVHTQLV
jgi:hypothetical protein